MTEPGTARSELAAGARWLTLATIGVGGLNYAYAFTLTRQLNPGAFAVYGGGQALLLAVGTVATSSVPWVLARALTDAADHEERRRAVAFALCLNLALGVLAAAVTAGLGLSIGGAGTALALGGSSVLILLSSTPAGWLQGVRRFGQAAALRMVDVVVKVVVGLSLVGSGAGATGALVGFAAGSGVVLAIGLVLCRADLGRVHGVLRAGTLWRNAAGIGAVQGLVSVAAALDVVLVASLSLPDAAAGSYQAATVLARVPLFFGGAVSVAAFPLLATSARAGGVIALSYRLFAILAVPYALALATMPPALLDRLFPPNYSEVHTLLPLLAVNGLALGLLNLVTTFFQSVGAFRPALALQLTGLAFALVAVAFGQQYGATGIAVAAAVSGTVNVALPVGYGVRRWQRPVHLAGPLQSVAAASGVTVLLLLLRPVVYLWLPAAAALGLWSVAQFIRSERTA